MPPAMHTRIAELIIKHLFGELSDDERLELNVIIATSAEYRKLYEDMSNPDILREEVERMQNLDKESSWKKIESTILSPYN
jgi:hypothetical protein